MAKSVKVVAEARASQGSSAMRQLRRTGKFPGIVYGVGKQPVTVQLDERAFTHVMGSHLGEHMIVDLEIPGAETRKVLLQEVQHHPITGRILHVDFHEISMTEKLRVEIPIELVGEPVGVTQQGGVLEHVVREIEVECLPTDLVEHFELNVSELSIGDSLSAGDVPLDPAKYTLITNKDIAIVLVSAPREEEVTPTPEEAAAAAAGPEVIMEKKEEGEEGEAAEGKEKETKAAGKEGAKEAKPAAAAKEAKPAGKEAKK